MGELSAVDSIEVLETRRTGRRVIFGIEGRCGLLVNLTLVNLIYLRCVDLVDAFTLRTSTESPHLHLHLVDAFRLRTSTESPHLHLHLVDAFRLRTSTESPHLHLHLALALT